MNGKIEMHIEISNEEMSVISKLLGILEWGCPFPLSNERYADIFRAIAHRETDIEIDDGFYRVCIEYEENEESD